VPKKDLKPHEKKNKVNQDNKPTEVKDLINKEQSIKAADAENITGKVGQEIKAAAAAAADTKIE
jgi:hypothetical protein